MASAYLLALIPLLYIVFKLAKFGRREPHLPPGPPTAPIVGNALQLPENFLQLQFSEWAQQYGDVISLKVFNSNMIVLSSAAAIRSVMDKKGLQTGGRPRSLVQPAFDNLHMVLENMSNPRWKRGRKTMHLFFTPENIHVHLPVQRAEALQMTYDLLDDPTNIYTHIMRTTCSVMTSLLYGKRTPQYYGSDAEGYFEGIKLLNGMNDATAFPPTEIMPFVAYIPKWIAPWTKHVERMKTVRNELYYRLFAEAETRYKNGVHTGSYVEELLKNQQEVGMDRDEMAFLALAIMDAGAETTASFIQNLAIALVAYPECQKKLHEEMDRVIGVARMPVIEDYEQLPYLRAFIEELHRFRPLMPLGLPHMASEDVTYNGYVIPAGSMLFQNTWGVFHDPELFDDPETFRPERFLGNQFGTKKGADVSDLRNNLSFGAGRRICPGEMLGRRSISLNAMNFVWSFDFTAKEKLTLDMKNFIVPGLEMAPKPFNCDVRVRDSAREKMIRAAHLANLN